RAGVVLQLDRHALGVDRVGDVVEQTSVQTGALEQSAGLTQRQSVREDDLEYRESVDVCIRTIGGAELREYLGRFGDLLHTSSFKTSTGGYRNPRLATPMPDCEYPLENK